ncbi:MAG: cation-translocating P-type ATPase [Candidatus Woesearchaeota archaeon]
MVAENFYSISVDESLKQLGSNFNGITKEESDIRLAKYGKNTLVREDSFRVVKMFLKQVNNILIYVLFTAGLISYFLDHAIEFYVIMFIIFITIILSFIQEYSADRTLQAISKLSVKTIEVLRSGQKITINSEDIVPGDIIYLKRGVIIPADLRVIESNSLTIDESILTGESLTKHKHIDTIHSKNVVLGDQDNMCFSGTSITSGRGIGLVVKTGLNTEIGKITSTIKSLEGKKTPLQIKVDKMSTNLSWIVIICGAILFVILNYFNTPLPISILVVGSVIVAGIPESFPLSMTLALSKGVKRMAKHNAIIKNLNSVETLGTTTVICSDKTGTLTENRMFAEKIMFADEKEFTVKGKPYEPYNRFFHKNREISVSLLKRYDKFLSACILCNDSELSMINKEWELIGEPTEGAFLTIAKSLKLNDSTIKKENKRIFEIPFDPKDKYMITVNKIKNKRSVIAYMKGASEKVIDKCTYYRINNKFIKLTSKKRSSLLKKIHSYSSEGLRVMAVATKELKNYKSDTEISKSLKNKFVLEGIVGIRDPIRSDVYEAILDCKDAGVEVIMITGDHKSTAEHIGKQLNIVTKQRFKIIEGHELDTWTDKELDSMIEDICIFARTTPEHKFRIVSSLQRKGEIVAMTGDGVNDAPALKKADIGVAMGKKGTDVAREASDMVLNDDNFTTIVQAIKEGRTIYCNIVRFIYYLLTGNFSQVGIIFLAVLFGFSMNLPLSPLMILFVNFVTSTFPALALSIEPSHANIMAQKPRPSNSKLLSRYIITKILTIAPVMLFTSFGIFLWEINIMQSSLARAMTMSFAVLIVSGLFHIFNAKRLHDTVFKDGFLKNPSVFVAFFASFFVTILAIHTEFGREIFGTISLNLIDWTVVFVLGFVIVVLSEVIKMSIREEFIEQSMLQGINIKFE